jgi:hypothetical protein
MNYHKQTARLALIGVLVLGMGCASNSPPAQSFDGLVLVPDTAFGEVYLRPGAQLSGFGSYGLEACSVAFRKNWLRDQNNASMDLGSRLNQRDVERIKKSLGAACDKAFRSALEEAPPYQLVDSFDGGETVMMLRPEIINLDISAPEKFSSSMSRSYTTEAGEMTLVLEGLDGTTGEVLFRVVDRQRSRDTMRLQWTNSVTNQAAANRVLKSWAGQLRRGLDQVTNPANNAP